MLKARILTAGILLPCVLVIILYCPTILVSAVAGVVFILAAWEWTKLIAIANIWARIFNILLMVVGGVLLKINNFPVDFLCKLAACWWLLSLLAIITYPNFVSVWRNKILGICIGWLMFIPCWIAITWVHGESCYGPAWVIAVCSLVWSADVGAYCFGRIFGKKKLAPKVSAGKTWAGVFGAFAFASLVVVFTWVFLGNIMLKELFIGSMIVVLFAIIGDLSESLFKRICGCKDSGNLLPGHGGVLDRIDSLLAAIPIAVLGLIWWITAKGG